MFESSERRMPMTVIGRSILDWEMSLCRGKRKRREALLACPYRERKAIVHTTSCPWTWHYQVPICCPLSCTNLASPFIPSQGPSTTKKIRIGLSHNSTMLPLFDHSLKASMLDPRTPAPATLTAIRPPKSRITPQLTYSPTRRRCLGALPQ